MSNSNPILERSLDEIIGEKKSERRNQPNRGGPARRGGKFNSRGGSNIQKPVSKRH